MVKYNNAIVASKAWNLLFAVVDWSVAAEKEAEEREKPPEPGLRQTLGLLVEHGRRTKAREDFVPRVVGSGDELFEDDVVLAQTRIFIEAWQKKQWGRLVPLMPAQLIGEKRKGSAAAYTKGWFDMHTIDDVEIDRVEYTQSSVAEIRGTATIDGTQGFLRLRWVLYDENGDLALTNENGRWHLAIVAPHTYLVDENGERLR